MGASSRCGSSPGAAGALCRMWGLKTRQSVAHRVGGGASESLFRGSKHTSNRFASQLLVDPNKTLEGDRMDKDRTRAQGPGSSWAPNFPQLTFSLFFPAGPPWSTCWPKFPAGRGRTLARALGGGDTTPGSNLWDRLRRVNTSPHPVVAAALAQLASSCSGLTWRLLPREPARKSRLGGRAPGINCRAPECRPPGALSGSDGAPGRRGRRDPPPGRAPVLARPGDAPRARARRLPGSSAAPEARWEPLTLETQSGYSASSRSRGRTWLAT